MLIFGPILVCVAAMLWATDAPFRSQLTSDLPSEFIVLVEHIVSVVVVLPILLWSWRDLRKLGKREWLAVLAIALGGSAFAAIAFTQSFHYVNPSVSILLQKLQPIIAIVLAALILKEHMHRKFWMWAALALFGAYLITFPTLAPRLYEGEAFSPNTIGVSLALVAALLWGASTVFGKFVLRKIAFQTMASLRFSVALVFLLIINLYQGTIPALSSVSSTDWLFLVIVGLTSGAVSLLVYYLGLTYTRASIATVAELGFPLAAVFVNAYFLPEAGSGPLFGLHIGQWIGTGVLIASIYMLSRVNREEAETGTVAISSAQVQSA